MPNIVSVGENPVKWAKLALSQRSIKNPLAYILSLSNPRSKDRSYFSFQVGDSIKVKAVGNLVVFVKVRRIPVMRLHIWLHRDWMTHHVVIDWPDRTHLDESKKTRIANSCHLLYLSGFLST